MNLKPGKYHLVLRPASNVNGQFRAKSQAQACGRQQVQQVQEVGRWSEFGGSSVGGWMLVITSPRHVLGNGQTCGHTDFTR